MPCLEHDQALPGRVVRQFKPSQGTANSLKAWMATTQCMSWCPGPVWVIGVEAARRAEAQSQLSAASSLTPDSHTAEQRCISALIPTYLICLIIKHKRGTCKTKVKTRRDLLTSLGFCLTVYLFPGVFSGLICNALVSHFMHVEVYLQAGKGCWVFFSQSLINPADFCMAFPPILSKGLQEII